jgi:hypothetical protein
MRFRPPCSLVHVQDQKTLGQAVGVLDVLLQRSEQDRPLEETVRLSRRVLSPARRLSRNSRSTWTRAEMFLPFRQHREVRVIRELRASRWVRLEFDTFFGDRGAREASLKLPDSEPLRVDREKVVQYLLNHEHPDGRGKALYFERFGFKASEWETLATALRAHGRTHEVVSVVESRFGTRYIVEGGAGKSERT